MRNSRITLSYVASTHVSKQHKNKSCLNKDRIEGGKEKRENRRRERTETPKVKLNPQSRKGFLSHEIQSFLVAKGLSQSVLSRGRAFSITKGLSQFHYLLGNSISIFAGNIGDLVCSKTKNKNLVQVMFFNFTLQSLSRSFS